MYRTLPHVPDSCEYGIKGPVTNHYHFLTRWRVRATPEEVYAIVSAPLEYPRWWPSVYLAVDETGPRRFRLHTRGWLPYTLRWDAETVVAERPGRIEVAASGDFEGRGIWSIRADGEFTDISFDWNLRAEKPVLRNLTFLLRPVFEANHRWAMEMGLQSLELELERSRAMTARAMNSIPAPPRPPHLSERTILAGALLAGGIVAALVISAGGEGDKVSQPARGSA